MPSTMTPQRGPVSFWSETGRGRRSELLREALVDARRAQCQIPLASFKRTSHLERARITGRSAGASLSSVTRDAHASIAAALEWVVVPLEVSSEIMHVLQFANSSSSSASRWPLESVVYSVFSRCAARTEDVEENSIVDRLNRWSLAGPKACSGSHMATAVTIGCDVPRIELLLTCKLDCALSLRAEASHGKRPTTCVSSVLPCCWFRCRPLTIARMRWDGAWEWHWWRRRRHHAALPWRHGFSPRKSEDLQQDLAERSNFWEGCQKS